MRVSATAIPDVLLLEPRVFRDSRGVFLESFNARTFAERGIETAFVQDNHSRSSYGVVRGLHYQLPHAQGKLIRVTRGRIRDIAVDLRRSSPTFGRWVAAELTEDNQHQLWIPPGFAHGFAVLSETADVLYKTTAYYAPEHEHCIKWDDADLAVDWGLPVTVTPCVSTKDSAGVAFADAVTFP